MKTAIYLDGIGMNLKTSVCDKLNKELENTLFVKSDTDFFNKNTNTCDYNNSLERAKYRASEIHTYSQLDNEFDIVFDRGVANHYAWSLVNQYTSKEVLPYYKKLTHNFENVFDGVGHLLIKITNENLLNKMFSEEKEGSNRKEQFIDVKTYLEKQEIYVEAYKQIVDDYIIYNISTDNIEKEINNICNVIKLMLCKK